MVICNECGTRIAPKVTVCPKCGANVDATNAGPPRRAPRATVPRRSLIVLGAAFALAVAAAYLLLR